MDVYRVALIGQGLVYNEAELRAVLERVISKIVREHDAVECYVSRENIFDLVATSSVRMVETSYTLRNSSVQFVLPHSVGKNDFLPPTTEFFTAFPTKTTPTAEFRTITAP